MNEIKAHNTMSPEAQRIKIAEACGWKFIADYCHGEDQPPDYTTLTPDGRHLCGYYPDYFNDLNAMHEAEQTLTGKQGGDYDLYLWLIIQRDKSRPASWHATAAQRCEAFLKTIGKWRGKA
jgi:hypothetical protein